MLESKIGFHFSKVGQFSCLLCGGAVTEEHPRDIDLIIYVETDDLKKSVEEIVKSFRSFGVKIRESYIKKLNLYSIKIDKDNLSLHIVSYDDLLEYTSHAAEPETYTDIDILAFTLNYATVYRTWIEDTKFLFGQKEMLINLRENLNDKIPVSQLYKIFSEKIKSTLIYYQEKKSTKLISQGLLILKLFRELLLYCYSMNRQFYGTIKYIDSDLEHFTNVNDMCVNCKEIFGSLRFGENEIDKLILKNIEEHFHF